MDEPRPSRRRLLSGGLVAAITATAGCLGLFDRRGSDDPGDTGGTGDTGGGGRALVLTLARDDGPLRESFVVDLADTERERDEAAFEAALADEQYTTRFRTPFGSAPEDPTYARRDGTYYRLGSVVVDEAAVVRPVLRLSAVGEAGGSTPEAVDASELPATDRRAVEVAHLAARARGNRGGAPWGLVRRGGYVYRGDAAGASTLLADDGPDRVVYRERVYAVGVSRERFHGPVYRATAEPVADTPERLEAILRAQFVDARLSRADLSEAAREVLRRARVEGYAETHPYSAGYRQVLRAMHERAYVDGDVERDAGVDDGGRQMLRYDDAYYDYRLRFRPEQQR